MTHSINNENGLRPSESHGFFISSGEQDPSGEILASSPNVVEKSNIETGGVR